ncbi:MAG TPA: hypothetical protein P5080_05065 [Candidatus Paceibacterota bacterium]|nr:hypothetical protein [Candidatus Paceibacterota bacterium]HSA37039.1 hypothetical protein [Candidatus Paceibacterota bacterium]
MFQLVVDIAHWRVAREPATFSFAFHTSPAVFAQVNNELIGHSALHTKKKHVVIGQVFAVYCLDALNYSLLEHPAQGSAINGVAGKPIDLPAEDAIGLAFFNTIYHIAKNRAIVWLFGGFGFG